MTNTLCLLMPELGEMWVGAHLAPGGEIGLAVSHQIEIHPVTLYVPDSSQLANTMGLWPVLP